MTPNRFTAAGAGGRLSSALEDHARDPAYVSYGVWHHSRYVG
jgi:hypothetical protein